MAQVLRISSGSKALQRAIIDIAAITVLWSLSSVWYYEIRDQMGLEIGYRDAPLIYSAYYLGFTLLAVLLFRHRIRDWTPPTHGISPVLAVLAMIVVFTLGILPILPEIDLSLAPRDPPEFMFADAMYYVAKSFEILFQQTLILTLVLLFHSFGWKTLQVGMLTAALFGLFHLSLIFNGATGFYVARFTIAATCFGAVVPSLFLTTRNGATLSYGLHWSFYIGDNIFTHFMLSSTS